MFCPAGAPLEITADLINTFNISLVVRGSVSETGRANDGDRYSVPKAQNIFRFVFVPTLSQTDALSLYSDGSPAGFAVSWHLANWVVVSQQLAFSIVRLCTDSAAVTLHAHAVAAVHVSAHDSAARASLINRSLHVAGSWRARRR